MRRSDLHRRLRGSAVRRGSFTTTIIHRPLAPSAEGERVDVGAKVLDEGARGIEMPIRDGNVKRRLAIAGGCLPDEEAYRHMRIPIKRMRACASRRSATTNEMPVCQGGRAKFARPP